MGQMPSEKINQYLFIGLIISSWLSIPETSWIILSDILNHNSFICYYLRLWWGTVKNVYKLIAQNIQRSTAGHHDSQKYIVNHKKKQRVLV